MASLKNGYAKIANELLEAVYSADLTAMQKEIIIFVMRFTYGWQAREFAELSYSFIANGIGRSRNHVVENVSKLTESGVLKQVIGAGRTVLGINDDVSQWRVNFRQGSDLQVTRGSDPGVTSASDRAVTRGSDLQVTQHTQTQQRQTINKNYIRDFDLLWELYPRKRGRKSVNKEAIVEAVKNADAVRRAIERYKAEIERQHTDEQFILYGSTFFNGRWRDYAESDDGDAAEAMPDGTMGGASLQ